MIWLAVAVVAAVPAVYLLPIPAAIPT